MERFNRVLYFLSLICVIFLIGMVLFLVWRVGARPPDIIIKLISTAAAVLSACAVTLAINLQFLRIKQAIKGKSERAAE